jgi:hypothetical protein
MQQVRVSQLHLTLQSKHFRQGKIAQAKAEPLIEVQGSPS